MDENRKPVPRLFGRIEKSPWLGRLPGSCREGSFWAGDPCGSWEEEEEIQERIFSRKQNKTRNERLNGRPGQGWLEGSPAYPVSARSPAGAPGGSRGPTWRFCAPHLLREPVA